MYINGFLDSLPFAVAFGLLSFLAPLPTAPVFVASLLQCYVVEEWVHYTVHFHRFRWRYFDYIRRHHLYHHSPRGVDIAFGLTSGMWDAVRNMLGNGLVVSEGSFWLRQRRMMQPQFHRQRLAALTDLMVSAMDEALDTWEKSANGSSFNVAPAFNQLTMKVITPEFPYSAG